MNGSLVNVWTIMFNTGISYSLILYVQSIIRTCIKHRVDLTQWARKMCETFRTHPIYFGPCSCASPQTISIVAPPPSLTNPSFSKYFLRLCINFIVYCIHLQFAKDFNWWYTCSRHSMHSCSLILETFAYPWRSSARGWLWRQFFCLSNKVYFYCS